MPFCKQEFEILKKHMGRGEEAFFTWLILLYAYIPIDIQWMIVVAQMIKDKTIRRIILIIATPLLSLYVIMTEEYISLPRFVVLFFIIVIAFIDLPKIDMKHALIAFLMVIIVDCIMQGSIEYISMLYYHSTKACTIFIFMMILLSISYTNKKWLYRIFCNLILVIGVINMIVLSITDKAVRFSDIKLLNTAMGVINGVHFPESRYIVIVLSVIAIIAFNIVISKIPLVFEVNWKRAAICIGIAAISILNIRMNAHNYLQYYGNYRYGIFINMLIENSAIKIPYEDEFVSGIEPEEAEQKDEFDKLSDKEKPNVIVILSEAFSDLETYRELSFDTEYIPYTRKIVKSCGGISYSSVLGNNTVSTEFAVLTGIPTGITKPGASLYDRIQPMPSLVKVFKNRGYKTIGIHPYRAIGYNRNKAWECFGFDQSIFEEEFEGAETYAPETTKFVADKVTFEKIVEKLDDDEPTFCFVVTMQNHASYYYLMNQTIHLKDNDDIELNNYLTLENYSDEALKMLIEKINQIDRDTYILFFGDHQPMFPTEKYEYLMDANMNESGFDKIKEMFKVPYFIWTNADKKYTVPQETSMNYLGGILLDILGIHDPWYAYTQEIRKLFPVITDNFFKYNEEWSGMISPQQVLKNVHNDGSDFSKLKQYQVYSKNRIRCKDNGIKEKNTEKSENDTTK